MVRTASVVTMLMASCAVVPGLGEAVEDDNQCLLQLSKAKKLETELETGCCFQVAPFKILHESMTFPECFPDGDLDNYGWAPTCPADESEAAAIISKRDASAAASSIPQQTAPGNRQPPPRNSGICDDIVVNVEDFEDPDWSETWTLGKSGGSDGVLVSNSHSGSYAYQGNGRWWYSNFALVSEGNVVEAWVYQPSASANGGGRVYLGFDSDETGTWTFVVGWNTNELIFQRNSGYGYSNQAVTSFSPPRNVWLRMKVTVVNATTVLGELFDSSAVLLSSLDLTYSISGNGTVALRTFGQSLLDDITTTRSSDGELCRPARGNCDVPEYCANKECPEDQYKPFGTVCDRELCHKKKSVCSGWCPECRR